MVTSKLWGTWFCSRFRHRATGQKVVDLIPNGVNGIFGTRIWNWINPSGLAMALVSTQPPIETHGLCVGLTTLPPSRTVWKSESLDLLEPSGPVQACTGIALPRLHRTYNSPYYQQTAITAYLVTVSEGGLKTTVTLSFAARAFIQHQWTCSALKLHILHFHLFAPLKQHFSKVTSNRNVQIQREVPHKPSVFDPGLYCKGTANHIPHWD
jgi:hypothetical protein